MAELTTISLGAGLQSSALVEMVVEGDLPPVDVAIFADTGDEPQYVYEQVEYLCGRLASVGIPLDVVRHSDMVADIYGGGRFAAIPLFTVLENEVSGFGAKDTRRRVGQLKRQCTREYKVDPIQKRIGELLLERGYATKRKNGIYANKGVKVESWLGITLDEAERMKPNKRKPYIVSRWPLIELRMTRQDCENWLRDRGLPIPAKSSCIRCPYHNDAYYAQMKALRPDDWDKVVQFDDDLRSGALRLSATAKGELYLHSSCIPLRDVDLMPDNGQMSFEFCDEGFCWT